MLSRIVLFAGSMLVAQQALAAGTIKGTVKATPAKYLDETVVYLKSVDGTYAPSTVSMDQKGMKFIPNILAIVAGSTVKFMNHDSVDHNVYTKDNEGYNLPMIKANESASYTFKQTGVYHQLCAVHPEMSAYVFVGQNPYMATLKNGKFEIANVPAGSYEIAIWNSKLKGATQNVVVLDGQTATSDFSLAR